MIWKILWGCILDGFFFWFGVLFDFFDSEEWLIVSLKSLLVIVLEGGG